MCLGIPATVLEIRDDAAVVAVGGARREVSLMLLDGVAAGDWVIVHAGFAIAKLDPDEAEETLRLLRGIADALP